MLTFFRGIIHSKVGVIVTFGVLIVIALAFAAGDVTGLASSTGLVGHPIASVGGESVTAADVRQQARDELTQARQEQPTLDMAQFVQLGGLDAVINRNVSALALETFGRDQGMRVSRALIGSELKAIPAFAGATGQFDQQAYERLIAQRGFTDAQVQAQFARQIMVQFLTQPTIGAHQVPQQLALTYASLLLERRTGEVAFVPATPSGAAPSDAEVQQWYQRNVARYTTPERRVIRYAVVGPQQVAGQVTPSDAEVQKAYDAAKATYAPKTLRDVTLVTVLDEKAARALAAKVKAGTPLAAAARAGGLEPRTISGADQGALATQTSPAVAQAIAAAASGAVVGPVRGAIGFVVARVDKVTQDPGKTLTQARDELITQLRASKTKAAIGAIRDKVDDSLADNANISEVVNDQKLSAQTTPALLQNGTNPDQPQTPADPGMTPIVAAAFAAEEGDTPTTVNLGEDGSFAVVALDRVVQPTPVPLAVARPRVIADLTADRAAKAAQQAASALVTKVNGGAALPAALSSAGVKAPPVQPISASRGEITARGQVNPVLAALFSMAPGSARAVPSPDGKGWLVLKLDQVVPGDARKQPPLIQATRADLGRAIGPEYAQQFANAVAKLQGAKRFDDAIAQLKQDLVGGGAQ
ncbi:MULTISPECIES: peptidylprolyl isomerase [unclassified Sphingomonas]|uniref:peptidylprolyl isomerase n=1 Tax=unclassified Sphingomonas TaxID=196159 RepID=UPI0016085542|nr:MULTISPECIES: peptidylprolyl isomerase [unclassified Sphingomonas]MBB3346264.1 peptidyl-prolyl cis-trans isomerase D [Sphingomonas sp. BK069]MBB3473425.1 peptidyl-prolyl cis-trans isomerase D [Sphingomonas sp. BK345]